ncbi:5-hydroxytryptamine receptor 3C-like [Syngnathus acus]|uniref:5-hydroxytryptamine receptor 3C-like n=1 Tax=Syngnathus acus TaxID=161584 RepID=UPI001885F24E|nr:5-hydroxytryptamine receptor 3C-like [Syngnathus acus]
MPNCSRPDGPALLEALKPVFDLRSIRPVTNTSTTTTVMIGFILLGILGVVRDTDVHCKKAHNLYHFRPSSTQTKHIDFFQDEKAQILTTFIMQILSWKNEFIKWDPNQCGTDWITLPRKLLWVPDVVINEFMEKNVAQFTPYTYVYANGIVLDIRPIRVVSSCRLDIYTFPFDIQNCTLTFNSYIHVSPAMKIGSIASVETLMEYSEQMMATMGEWELIGIKALHRQKTSSTNSTYEELRFFISVRRRSLLYVVNLLIPSCFLITVDLFSFLLPPQKVDRSLFKMTLILGYTVYLLLMNDFLPITGNTLPLINVFLSLCLGLMVASLLETILITNLLHSSAHYPEVPRWIRLLVIHMMGRLVLIPPKPKQVQQIIQNPLALDGFLPASPTTEMDTQRGGDGGAHGPEGPLDRDKVVEELRSLGRDLRVIRLKVEQELNVSQSTEEWIQVAFIIDRLLFTIYILFLSASFILIIVMSVNSYNASI